MQTDDIEFLACLYQNINRSLKDDRRFKSQEQTGAEARSWIKVRCTALLNSLFMN